MNTDEIAHAMRGHIARALDGTLKLYDVKVYDGEAARMLLGDEAYMGSSAVLIVAIARTSGEPRPRVGTAHVARSVVLANPSEVASSLIHKLRSVL